MSEEKNNETPKNEIHKAKRLKNFQIKKISLKKILLVLLAITMIVIAGWLIITKALKPKPKQLYQVAVMVRDQSGDISTALKSGDVLIIQDDGHKWSRTESVSYLILKMELTEEQKQKLLSSDEKELEFEDLSEEEQKRIKEEEQRAKDEGREYEREPRRETLRTRAYRIDLEKLGFSDPASLIKAQPFAGQVFNWGIVEKKEKIK
jgi:cell division protein FtsL